MLSSMGLESPVFDFLDQVSQKTKPKKPVEPVNSEEKLAERGFQQIFGTGMGVVSREKDVRALAGVSLSTADIEVIKSYMEILDDVCFSSQAPEDMMSDIAREIYQYSQAVYTRCVKLIEAKSANGVKYQLDVLMSLAEALDVRLKFFKNTFIDLTLKQKNIVKKEVGKPKPGEKEEEKKSIPVIKPKAALKPLPPPPSNPFFQFEAKAEPLIDLLDGTEEKKEVKKEAKNESQNFDLLQLNLEPKVPLPEFLEIKEAVPEKKEEDDFFESLANRK